MSGVIAGANLKKSRLTVGLLLMSVIGSIVLGSVIVLHDVGFDQSGPSGQTPSSNTLGGSLYFAGDPAFQFEGSNVSELTVAAGSSAQGVVPMKIVDAFSFNFYVDDRGTVFNTTKPTLPSGISVSIGMYGNRYDAVSLTDVYANPSLPLVPTTRLPLVSTTIGETSVRYTVNVASGVPAGAYKVLIVFQSVTNDGELYGFEKGTLHYGYADIYEVLLHVQ
jgi:hypothetical protein